MAKVQFKRYETDLEAQESDVIDGQFIVTKEGTSYIDCGEERVAFGGTPDTQMSDTSQNSVQNKVVKEYVDGIVLYDNSTGTNDNINLNDSLSNYSKIKVFSKIVMPSYTTNYVNEFEAIVGNRISINSARMHSDELWINDCTTYLLNTQTITKVYESDVRIGEGGAAAFNKNTTRTLITKVVGYN